MAIFECWRKSPLAALQAQPEPPGEHQHEIKGRKLALDYPIDNRKDHDAGSEEKPENHAEYAEPLGPRDKPENVLQHPGDQRDQHTHGPQRVFVWVHLEVKT